MTPLSLPPDLRVLYTGPKETQFSFTLYQLSSESAPGDQTLFFPVITGEFGPAIGQPTAFKTLGKTQNSAVVLTQKKELHLLSWSHWPTQISLQEIRLPLGIGAPGAYPKQLSDSVEGGVWILWSDGTVSEIRAPGRHAVLFTGYQLPTEVNGVKLGRELKGFQQISKDLYAAFSETGFVWIRNTWLHGKREWTADAVPIRAFTTLHLATQQFERLAHLSQAVFDPSGKRVAAYSGLEQFPPSYNQFFDLDLTNTRLISEFAPNSKLGPFEIVGLTTDLDLLWRQSYQWNQKKHQHWFNKTAPQFLKPSELSQLGIDRPPVTPQSFDLPIVWDWPTQISGRDAKQPLSDTRYRSSLHQIAPPKKFPPANPIASLQHPNTLEALIRELERLPAEFTILDLIRFVSPYTQSSAAHPIPVSRGPVRQLLARCTDVELWQELSLDRYGLTYEPLAHQTQRRFKRIEMLNILKSLEERHRLRSTKTACITALSSGEGEN